MLNISLWQATAQTERFPELIGDTKADVLVIGGGMTGLLCAHMLTRSGADCLLIEANRLCGGTSGHTTAKLTSQHALIYDRLLRSMGKERAHRSWQHPGRENHRGHAFSCH